MSYRVETASSGRAVCRAKECKDAGVKIAMGDLRLGVWVPYEDHGSWHWKHWGCVTGAQVVNMREYLSNGAGGYNWDALDGYDGEDKNSLTRAPDLQEKVRKAVEQGHVDDEDFNGDLEMNKLGEKGLRTTVSKKKLLEAQRSRQHELDELKEQNAALQAALLNQNGSGASASKIKSEIGKLESQMEELSTPLKKKATSKKRVRGADDEEDVKPAKKSRAKKAVKKEESESDNDSDVLADLDALLKQEDEEEKPVKKSRGKKAIKKEENEELDGEIKDEHVDEKPKPARKSRAKKQAIKNEEGETADESEVMPAPSKRSRAKKGAKKEEEEVIKDEQVDELPLPPPKKSARGKKVLKNENVELAVKKEPAKRKGRKGAAKNEPDEETAMADIPDIMDEAQHRRYPEDHIKDELKHGLYPYDDLGELGMDFEQIDEYTPPPAEEPTGGRAPKKAKAAPKASTSARATRSRKA